MAKNREFFTSESVTEGHPDKMADQISDSILDAILAKDKNARVACETLVTTGMVHVVGEISTTCYVDIPHIVREPLSHEQHHHLVQSASDLPILHLLILDVN